MTFVTFFLIPYWRKIKITIGLYEIMTTQEIKEKYTCLNYLGQPVKKTRNCYLYHVPWREDKTPSLSVTLNGKGWHDLAKGHHGSVIDLVMRCLNTTSVKRACEEIERQASLSSSFSQQISEDGEKNKEQRFTKFEVVKLQSPGLFAYLYSRKIDLQIAKQFLQEAHYSFKEVDDGRYLYALAYANDKGGYELRGAPYKGKPEGYKGGTSPKAITTHLAHPKAATIVFEGFMDMLSFATLCGKVRHNYIVLNSIVNAPAAIEVLRFISSKIYLCLDNDKGGNDATAFIQNAVPTAIDIRSRFAPAKDVNDFLINKQP